MGASEGHMVAHGAQDISTNSRSTAIGRLLLVELLYGKNRGWRVGWVVGWGE